MSLRRIVQGGGVVLATALTLQTLPAASVWAATAPTDTQQNQQESTAVKTSKAQNTPAGSAATPVATQAQATSYEVKAPASNVRGVLAFDETTGTATYAVFNGDESIVKPSALGLKTNLGDFTTGLKLQGQPKQESGTDSYKLIGGKKSQVNAKYNQTTYTFTKDGSSAAFSIIVRAYDDGVAVRYAINGTGELQITDETTALNVPDGTTQMWKQDAGDNSSVANEWDFGSWWLGWGIKGTRWNMPLLYRTDKGYALFSEAEILTGTYCGSVLSGKNDNSGFDINFAPEQGSTPVKTDAKNFTSPWRFVVTGNLNDIVNNTMAENLSKASVLKDDSWVEPGVMDWTWLNGDLRHDQIPADQFEKKGLEIYKKYIDLAADMGWKYQLLDEGWMIPYSKTTDKEKQPGYDPNWQPSSSRSYLGYYSWTQDLIKYAKDKGVKLIVWVPASDLSTPKLRERLAYWASLGIAGIKPDFFDSADQNTLALVHTLLEQTAEDHLLINTHGSVKAVGERRTYPNALTKEAVGGAEGYAVEDWRDPNNYGGGDKPWGGYHGSGATDNARYNCTLPFTRNAVGPMDYTPLASFGSLNNVRMGPTVDGSGSRQEFDNPPRFTLAHEFALPIIYESGLQCLADKPGVYQNLEGHERFWKNFPAQWDETKLLDDSSVGELVEMARRHDTDWYLGVIAANDQQKDISVPLDFLEDGTTYTAYIYRDNLNKPVPGSLEEQKATYTDPSKLNDYVTFETKTVKKGDKLDLTLAAAKSPVYQYQFTGSTGQSRSDLIASGGAAVRLVKNAESKPDPDPEPKPDPTAQHTVTFNSNGGSVIAPTTVTDGKPVAKPDDPAREGYTFAGWYTDATLTTAHDFSKPVTSDLTLYAKWTKKNEQGNQGGTQKPAPKPKPDDTGKKPGNTDKKPATDQKQNAKPAKKSGSSSLPQTGDNAALTYAAAGGLIALAGGAFALARRVRKNR